MPVIGKGRKHTHILTHQRRKFSHMMCRQLVAVSFSDCLRNLFTIHCLSNKTF